MLVVLRTTAVLMKPLDRNIALIATSYISLITSFQPPLALFGGSTEVQRGGGSLREEGKYLWW